MSCRAASLPPILTPSLILRQFVPEDAAKIFLMSQEPGMHRWLPDQVYDDERAALGVLSLLIAHYHDPGTPVCGPYVLGCCLRRTSELIGHVGLSPLRDQVEIGYAIRRTHQGRGLATEAVAALSDWGIRHFGLPLILGIAASENIASWRVLERAGYTLIEESLGILHGVNRLLRTYRRDA